MAGCPIFGARHAGSTRQSDVERRPPADQPDCRDLQPADPLQLTFADPPKYARRVSKCASWHEDTTKQWRTSAVRNTLMVVNRLREVKSVGTHGGVVALPQT
jgi:hypothetical protein